MLFNMIVSIDLFSSNILRSQKNDNTWRQFSILYRLYFSWICCEFFMSACHHIIHEQTLGLLLGQLNLFRQTPKECPLLRQETSHEVWVQSLKQREEASTPDPTKKTPKRHMVRVIGRNLIWNKFSEQNLYLRVWMGHLHYIIHQAMCL